MDHIERIEQILEWKATRGPGPAGKPAHIDVNPLLGHADPVLGPDTHECPVLPVPIEHVLCQVRGRMVG